MVTKKKKAPVRNAMFGDNNLITRLWLKYFDKVDETIEISEDNEVNIPSGTYDAQINTLNNRLSEIEKYLQDLSTPNDFTEDIRRIEDLAMSGIYSYDNRENMKVFTSLGKYQTKKDITFSNDTGTITVFTVTGDVFVNILPVVTGDLVSAAGANIRLGVVGNTDAMIVDSLATNLDAYGIWVDQTPDYEIEPIERVRGYFITNGNDVVLTLSDQIDSGSIRFYCWWSPLPFSEGAGVV